MRNRAAIFLSCVALIAIGVAVLAPGQIGNILFRLLVDGGVLIAWIAAMIGWGAIVRSILRGRVFNHRTLLDWIISVALGVGSVSILILILGLFGAMNRVSAWTIIVIGVVAFVIALRRTAKPQAAEGSNWNWLWLLAAPAVSIVIVCAFVPPGVLWGDEPNGYDVLEYHLQVPREWYEAGKISPLSHNVYSYFPMNVEMHYLLAMNLRGGPWAGMYLTQLMHASLIALSVVAIYALTIETVGPPVAIVASISMLAAPWLLLLAPIAYDEGGLIFFGTLSIGLIWRALREQNSWKDWSLAGAMCGFACGTKLTAIPMLLLAIPLAALLALRGKMELKKYGAFLAIALLTSSPWFIRNIAWTGNPFFPEAAEVFGRGKFTETQQVRWKLAHAPTSQQRSISARFKAADDQIIRDWRFGYALIPLALIGIAFQFRRREAWFLLALLMMSAIFWIGFTHLQSRFFVLAIPICALAIAGGIEAKPILRPAFACILSLAIVVGLVNWHEQYSPLIAKMTDANALGMDKLDWMGVDLSTVSDSARVELVGDARAFVYSRPMSTLQYRTVFDVEDSWTGDGNIQAIDPSEIRRLSNSYFKLPPAPASIENRSSSFLIQR